MAPYLKILASFNKLIMVLSRPIFEALPEIIPSIFPDNRDMTCSAFVALTVPDGLADGAARGVFESFKIF